MRAPKVKFNGSKYELELVQWLGEDDPVEWFMTRTPAGSWVLTEMGLEVEVIIAVVSLANFDVSVMIAASGVMTRTRIFNTERRTHTVEEMDQTVTDLINDRIQRMLS